MTVHPPSGPRGIAPPALPPLRRLLPPAGRAIRVRSALDRAERRIRERPLRAAVLAFAVGIVLGKVIR